MPDPFDDSSYTERFEPESPLGEVRPPQFSLRRLLVFVSVAALAAALFGAQMRLAKPIVDGFPYVGTCMLAIYIAVRIWQRSRARKRCGEVIARLRMSYWPMSRRRFINEYAWRILSLLVIVFWISPDRLGGMLLIGFLLTVIMLAELILAVCWRRECRDVLLCAQGMITNGSAFHQWKQLRSFQSSPDHLSRQVELDIPEPGLWSTNRYIALVLSQGQSQVVLEFLEQKAGEWAE